MKHIKFKGMIRKVACSHVVTIPNDFIKYGLLKAKKKYNIKIEIIEIKEAIKNEASDDIRDKTDLFENLVCDKSNINQESKNLYSGKKEGKA